ncbi:hypothetical protein CEXT_608451 [Caerostris extrusa]|uniref:Uncharacterized protein n=1 Tax=Caerostris extrusa TaxID=172846 RepID=A0AAV4R874_CAEEX|nr:hypothetical protein CEXT_608451 [Caerostris extrusa]
MLLFTDKQRSSHLGCGGIPVNNRSTGSSCIQNKGVAQTINKPSGSPIHRYPHDPRGAIAPEELPVGTTRPRAALQTTAAPPLPTYWASSAMNWKPTYTGIPMTRIRYSVSAADCISSYNFLGLPFDFPHNMFIE